MFIHASEASEFLPVAEGHPVLLDASTTEVLGDIETSVSPLLLEGSSSIRCWSRSPREATPVTSSHPDFKVGILLP